LLGIGFQPHPLGSWTVRYLSYQLLTSYNCNYQLKVMLRPTVSRSVLSWCQAPIWGSRPYFYYCQTVTGLLIWDSLSDERTGLSFTIAAGPRQCSHSRVWVPRDSWPHFTVSDSRLPKFRGPGPRIYIPQGQGGPVIPPVTGSLFVASYHSQGCGGGIQTCLHARALTDSNNWITSPRYVAPARTARKPSLPLLRVLSLPGKQRVHRAVPWQRLLYYRLFTQRLLGSGCTCHSIFR
jgi:hypothetical protein